VFVWGVSECDYVVCDGSHFTRCESAFVHVETADIVAVIGYLLKKGSASQGNTRAKKKKARKSKEHEFHQHSTQYLSNTLQLLACIGIIRILQVPRLHKL
jgi:hypothetical protein